MNDNMNETVVINGTYVPLTSEGGGFLYHNPPGATTGLPGAGWFYVGSVSTGRRPRRVSEEEAKAILAF